MADVTYNGVNLNDTTGLFITSLTGLSPINTINTSSIAGYDGATYISEQMQMRNITVTLLLKSVEDKQLVYDTFKIKKTGIFQYDDKKIECKVESIDIPTYQKPIQAFVSLLCPQPYFTAIEPNTKLMSAVAPLFRFPFHFNGAFKFSERMASVIENFVNDSSVEVYPIIEFVAKTSLENPSIMNINTYEKAKVNISMNAGDKVIIDTRKGYKNITLIRNGVESDIFNLKADDFRFFKLYVGDNYLKYDADVNPGGLQTTIKWESLYGGV